MRQYYRPMLAGSARAPFSSERWLFEVKWDGIRAISYVNDDFSIRSRNGRELKHNFPELAELRDLTDDAVVDGEIILFVDGRADFQTLLERNQTVSPAEIERLSRRHPSTYAVFDLLERGGRPLLDVPLVERKRALREHVREGRYVVLSDYVEGSGEAYYEAALARGLEGVIAKRVDSTYQPGKRSSDWLKVKRVLTCDCVVFGYTAGRGRRQGSFGALVLGLYDGAAPRYVGRVGTGFSSANARQALDVLGGLEAGGKAPFPTGDAAEGITWVRPELVCEVGYQAVTRKGVLRMPTFVRFRVDKAPRECTVDQLGFSGPTPETGH